MLEPYTWDKIKAGAHVKQSGTNDLINSNKNKKCDIYVHQMFFKKQMKKKWCKIWWSIIYILS